MVEQADETKPENAIDEFKRLGDKASYHFADDSCKEWGEADRTVVAALQIFDEHPEHQTAMREVARKFLWCAGFERRRPEIASALKPDASE